MKRIISTLLTLTLVLGCCCVPVFASSSSVARASLILTQYSAILEAGENRNEIKVSFTVLTDRKAESLGVETIKLYKANGNYVSTINGTIENGLVATNNVYSCGTYVISLTSGVSYYAEVTIFADNGTVYDSRTVTTATVKAP